MKRHCPALWFALVALAAVPASGAARAADEFIPLFDGKSFTGWKAPDMSWWSIEEGAITGRISREHPCGTNQYLVWQGGELADFELKLKSRVNGEGAINNGFQFRSRVLPDGDVAGYQMDNNLQTDWLVRLYDEFGRHTLAFRGKRSYLDPEGRAVLTDLKEGAGPPWFRLETWHEYHLVCRGPMLTLSVDGRLAAEVEDQDRVRSDLRGVLALQLHSGPPTVVQFKDIRLKVTRPATTIREPRWTRADSNRKRQLVLGSATAYWDLGVGGHGAPFPLRQAGDLDFDVRASGPGALRGATVAEFRQAWFDAGKTVGPSGNAFTCYVRTRDPGGAWNHALLSKRGPKPSNGFALVAETLDGATGPEVALHIRTEVGWARLAFPVSQIQPTAWHDLVGRYDGQYLELLCDGTVMARRAWAGGALAPNDAPFLVGADGESGQPSRAITGQLEEAAIWQRALSDADVAALMRVRELRHRPRHR